ncbi:unnamed protein product [Pieris macdunnoughi]|uniref:Secreted protein n=1 Tax=Pieris macdunnoughi TaxID=345717 RepID=A0A821U981_9NEOP|nr:unnamed protein product [Pieris macdunnoughi]
MFGRNRMKPVIIPFVLLLLWIVIGAQYTTTDCPGCSDMTGTPTNEEPVGTESSIYTDTSSGTDMDEGTTKMPPEA